jgi:hypothetical protein
VACKELSTKEAHPLTLKTHLRPYRHNQHMGSRNNHLFSGVREKTWMVLEPALAKHGLTQLWSSQRYLDRTSSELFSLKHMALTAAE